MTRARLLNSALILLTAATLCACGGGNLPAATPASPGSASTPGLVGAVVAIPSVVVPWTAAKVPQQALQQVSEQARKLPSDSQLGPPSWVKPGIRITYYQAAASVAESNFAWVEDPNGNWTDPTTGKRYRRTDESGEGVPTSSGDGFTQIDVLAVEGTDVVLSTVLYPIDHINNQFFEGGSTGAKVKGDTVDGTWVNPTELAQLQEQQIDNVLILRGDYVLNGTTYHAISFANTTPGNYQSYTYDTETGLLLSATTNTAGQTSNLAAPGENPPQGNSELTITRLAGVRQRTVPGINGTNPDWVAQTSQLQYSGIYNATNPVDPSSGSFTLPMEFTVSLGQGGRNWATFTSQYNIEYQGSQPIKSGGVTGTTGLYWVDQNALGSMSAGQVLDTDPLTGEQLTVNSVDGGVVSITSNIKGIITTVQYDRSSGVMLNYLAQFAESGTTIQLQLQGRP